MKLKIKNKSYGFTLIELLIVIALIGALAVGLIAAIDPVDQINRAKDVERQKIAADYLAAQERVYAANNGTFAAGSTAPADVPLNSTNGAAAVTALQNAGEVKATFVARANAADPGGKVFIISQNSATGAISLAYEISSKSFKNNSALTKATTRTGSTACTPSSTCYVQVTN